MALMAFMAKGERTNATVEAAASPVLAVPAAPRTVSPSTSVDASSELDGHLRCRETLRIDGRVRGEIECEKTVLVGEGAKVRAKIAADEVQISGVVEGDIAARRKITLQRTAVVVGDLTTPGIVIEEGAKLQGRIVIGSEAEPAHEAKKPRAAEKPAVELPRPGEASASQSRVASA